MKLQKVFDKLEKRSISIDEYTKNNKLCGYELNTYTYGGVNMILFLDFRNSMLNPTNGDDFITMFKERINDIDIDEEIDLHRQEKLFRDCFSIKDSVKDFTNWKKDLIKIFK